MAPLGFAEYAPMLRPSRFSEKPSPGRPKLLEEATSPPHLPYGNNAIEMDIRGASISRR
jgi:hypothetical protein